MTWQDRQQEARFVSAGGSFSIFNFESITVTQQINAQTFDFIDVDGVLVQQNGLSGRTVQMSVIFNGFDHDLRALEFSKQISETGVGTLTHPTLGEMRVVPYGSFTRINDYVRARNETVFDVTFVETLEDVNPNAGEDASGTSDSLLDEVFGILNTVYDTYLTGLGVLDRITSYAKLKRVIGLVSDIFQAASEIDDRVKLKFGSFVSTIATLGQGIFGSGFGTRAVVVNVSSGVAPDMGRKFKSIQDSIRVDPAVSESEFVTADTVYASCIISEALSRYAKTYDSRPEAGAAVVDLLESLDAYTLWRESNPFLNDPKYRGVYEAVLRFVVFIASSMVRLSFNLKKEVLVITDREHSPLDLCFECYGSMSDIERFLAHNAIEGMEMFNIPIGRKIVYYI